MNPHERTQPPRRPKVVETVGCVVCGADPTRFLNGDPSTPLCASCDTVALPTAAAFLIPLLPAGVLSMDPRALLTAILFAVGMYALGMTTGDEGDADTTE